MNTIIYENVDFTQYTQDKDGYITIPVYHGCVKIYNKIDLTTFRTNTDFGQGFYTTVLFDQAAKWAYKLHNRNLNILTPFVYTFNFKVKIKEDQILNLKIKKFNKMDKAWLDEITNNRCNKTLKHLGVYIPLDMSIDCLIGAMLDGVEIEERLMEYHNSGRINPDNYIKLMKFKNHSSSDKYTNQIAFRTYKGLTRLTATRLDIVKPCNNYYSITPVIRSDGILNRLNRQFKESYKG
jgi:hypothetical protein